ncbi:MAG: DUF1223 domain-containing protein [Bauldia sp.]|nr:DUF1223 domain-containing protein [Bauldia sp.]
MKIKIILRAGLVASAAAFALAATPSRAGIVLELFTSQGCPGCPAADALLADYVGAEGIVTLTYPVDYWDYLGWKDTLATRDNTLRQWAYAAARGANQVYTPQIVVDGTDHMIGSEQGEIAEAIAQATAMGRLDVPVAIAMEGASLRITVGAAGFGVASRATIWIALFDETETVAITGGDNAGQTVTYHNVVRAIERAGIWRGNAMTFELPTRIVADAGADGVAVLLQQEIPTEYLGPILGAASFVVHAN